MNMNILLDTHILLWALTEDPKLPQKAISFINDKSNVIFYSVVSIWETAIKHIKSPEKLSVSHHELVNFCKGARFKDLTLDVWHVDALETLRRPDNAPPHHDPFDRILIAQAKSEDMTFLTHDDNLALYHEPCVIVV